MKPIVGKFSIYGLPCEFDTLEICDFKFTFTHKLMNFSKYNIEIGSDLQELRKRIVNSINKHTPFEAKSIYKYIIKLTIRSVT